jgi:3-oxoacyl-[acyl-carrier-protein] synthase-3
MSFAWNGLLQSSGLSLDDIDLIIPHQAGLRIIQKGLALAGIPPEKAFLCLQDHGNAGSTALQAALAEAERQGRLRDGAIVVLLGFGTGWHCGAAAFRHQSRLRIEL